MVRAFAVSRLFDVVFEFVIVLVEVKLVPLVAALVMLNHVFVRDPLPVVVNPILTVVPADFVRKVLERNILNLMMSKMGMVSVVVLPVVVVFPVLVVLPVMVVLPMVVVFAVVVVMMVVSMTIEFDLDILVSAMIVSTFLVAVGIRVQCDCGKGQCGDDDE